MRKLTRQQGLDIISQGARQYMAMGFEDTRGTPTCPFKSHQTVETKMWIKGYLEARFKWQKANPERKSRKRVTKNSSHGEITWGQRVGNEAW